MTRGVAADVLAVAALDTRSSTVAAAIEVDRVAALARSGQMPAAADAAATRSPPRWTSQRRLAPR